tara:strand:+ start:135 stop:542 length:408 start_codon:yes stop_codon:yes gene_type:complete
MLKGANCTICQKSTFSTTGLCVDCQLKQPVPEKRQIASSPESIGPKLSGSPQYISNYQTAITLSKIIFFIGCLDIAFGVLGLFLIPLTGLGILAFSFGAVISGILIIASAQLVSATVDNADHTREILKIMQDRNS